MNSNITLTQLSLCNILWTWQYYFYQQYFPSLIDLFVKLIFKYILFYKIKIKTFQLQENVKLNIRPDNQNKKKKNKFYAIPKSSSIFSFIAFLCYSSPELSWIILLVVTWLDFITTLNCFFMMISFSCLNTLWFIESVLIGFMKGK